MVIKVLKHRKLLVKIIKRAKLLDKEQFLGDILAQILVYDVLFGVGVRGKFKVWTKQPIREDHTSCSVLLLCSGCFKGLVKRNYDTLNEALTEFMTKYQVSEREDLLKIFDDNMQVAKPKYIYLNTLSKTKKDLKRDLKTDNYEKQDYW